MRIVVLHLSDIHFRPSGDAVALRANRIKEAVIGSYPQLDACFIAVSGDIADTGAPEEYLVASAFFNELRAALLAAGVKQVEMLFVPGNHDCNLRREQDTRRFALEHIESYLSKPLQFDGLNFEAIIDVQAEFFGFEAEARDREMLATKDRLYFQHSYNIEGQTVVFHCFNTAWLSQKNEVQSALYFPMESLNGTTPKDALLSIAMFHHPYGWLKSDNYRKLREFVEREADLILIGHEHVSSASRKSLPDGQVMDYLEAAALQEHGSNESGFQIVSYNTEEKTQQVTKFDWLNDHYSSKGVVEWKLARNSARPASPFRSSEKFIEKLQRLGTGFKHRRKNLELRDVYVYPDLRHRQLDKILSGETVKHKTVLGDEICDFVEKHGRVLVYGANDAGKSSLCKILYTDFQKRGYVPLLIEGEQLRKCKSIESLQAVVNGDVKAQYGDSAVEQFARFPKEKRMLLVDDFQLTRLTRVNQLALINAIAVIFDTVVIVASDLFRMQEFAHSEQEGPFGDFEHCDIKEFGIYHRQRLIEKWHYLGREDSVELEAVNREVAQTDKTIATLLGKNVLPHYPLFILSLLTLLQTNDSPNTANGSYGYLYEVLIKAALASGSEAAGGDVDGQVTYFSGIAYSMFKSGRMHLSEKEFRTAHNTHCERFDMVYDFSQVIAEAERVEIVEHSSGNISFKYPYIFYYFVAKYFQENSSTLKPELTHMAEHIYKDVNANVLIFYVYLTKQPELIASLLANARLIYDEYEACNMDEHVTFVNEMYTVATKFVLPSSDTRKNRDDYNRRRDGFAEQSNVNAPDPEEPEDCKYHRQLQDVIKLNIAFKTLQILGQVLRNFPGSLDGTVKMQITEECYLLGLRTLRALLQIAETNLDGMREYVSGLIAERTGLSDGELSDQTDRAIIWLTIAAAYGTVKRISYAVGHEDLSITYDKVLVANDTLATRIITSAIRLDHFDNVDDVELARLRKRVKDNLFAYTIVRDLVGDYLYLYRPAYPVMQKLGAMWNIDISSPKYLVNRSKKE